MDLDKFSITAPSTEPESRAVVRLKTSIWSDNRGLHIKKSLNYLRRSSVGFNVLEEDIGAIGAEYVPPRILNLDECADGIFEVVTCNEKRTRESGCVDDYDYKLIHVTV